jgi:Tfp pilus assembly protein PilF
MRYRRKWLLLILAVLIVAGLTLSLPPVWSRVTYHTHNLVADIKYRLNPPQAEVFVPSGAEEGNLIATAAAATLTALVPTPTSPILPTEEIRLPSSTPTFTPVPLPTKVYLPGVTPEPQLWNNCGPATLSMNLSFYQWGKTQVEAAEALKPNPRDKNVMPYEMVNFVNSQTSLRALSRMGGDVETLKRLLNAGFPVLVEKGFEPGNLKKEGWMGHFNLVIGYNDDAQSFITQDSYLLSHPPGGGEIKDLETFPGFTMPYEDMQKDWRAFNYVLIVVYPPEKENDVLNALGPLMDENGAYQLAYERARMEATTLSDVRERFFAWFNAGTSLVYLADYNGAAAAYDSAFNLYAQIPENDRPWRMMWYQTGPYFAYYYSARYTDVINLADQTLKRMTAEPILEESYYWRGMAYLALGDNDRARAEFRDSLKYHPGFGPSLAALEQMGETP